MKLSFVTPRQPLAEGAFGEAELREVGALICAAVTDFAARKDEIEQRVDALCKRFPLYEGE